MFIKYSPKVSHIKVIPLIPTGKSSSFDNDTVTLRPGTNEIKDNEWEAIKPHIENQIKNGEITPFSVPVKKGSGKKAGTLKDVPLATARKIIQACQDPATLKMWFNQELPDELLLVLSKRMRKLKVEPDDLPDDDAGLELKDSDITPEGNTEATSKTDKDDIEDETSDEDEEEGDEDELSDEDDDDIPDFDGSGKDGGE